MNEAASVFVSVPFRAEGLDSEHTGCLKTFDSRQIDRFLTALYKEISAVSEECGDLIVREITVGNGSASHLTAEDLTQMIHTIRKQFRVSPQAEIRFHMTPAGFDFFKMNAVRQQGASICFELPALTDEGLRASGYRCTAATAKDALESCFQNNFRQFSVFLTARTLGTEEAEQTIKALLPTHPEEIFLREDADEQLKQTVGSVLEQEQWIRKENRWYREAVPKPLRCSVQIGCGPGAVSVFDGAALKSTSDFDFYCDHSDDFEALVQHALSLEGCNG